MKSILLVEDDPLIGEIYLTKLKEEFNVELIDEPTLVVERLKKDKFDLLILDLVLPKIDGFEILKNIKKDPDFKKRSFKILILSNLGEEEDIKRGLKLGADKYLIKAHYTPSQIIQEIKEILS